MEKVFNGYYKTIQENYQFELQTIDYRDRLKLLDDECRAAYKEAEAAREEAENELRSQQERDESARRFRLLAERVQAKEREMVKFRQTEGQQLQARQAGTVHKLVEELTALIKDYTKKQRYTMVYEVSGMSTNQTPLLLLYPEDKEITDILLRVVNAGHENEAKEAKKKIEELEAKNKVSSDEKLKP